MMRVCWSPATSETVVTSPASRDLVAERALCSRSRNAEGAVVTRRSPRMAVPPRPPRSLRDLRVHLLVCLGATAGDGAGNAVRYECPCDLVYCLRADDADPRGFGDACPATGRRRRSDAQATSTESAAAGFVVSIGRKTSKREPCPGALSTTMRPPWSLIMPCTTARPSPVPLPTSLVVKNGSKSRALVVSSMPQPLSVTDRRS